MSLPALYTRGNGRVRPSVTTVTLHPEVAVASRAGRKPACSRLPRRTRTAGMRTTGPRVQALLAASCAFQLLPNGFTNRD